VQQAQALGQYWQNRWPEYWQEQQLGFAQIWRGSLKRHQQTLAGICPQANAQVTSRLNEYDSEAIIHAVLTKQAQELPPLGTPAGYKAHFQVLRTGLQAWIEGQLAPEGMPSFAQFRAGIAEVLDEIRSTHGAENQARILVVSSGGPIATAVMHLLGAPASSMIDLNYQIRNTAITTLQVSKHKLSLSGFNHLPHLDTPDKAAWITST
jgi:broad specificity phosphatase PhoE